MRKTIIAGNWKILSMQKPFGKGDWELFNLVDDPGELNDLSNQFPGKCKELITLWEKYKEDNGVLEIKMDI